ncbi:acetylglutamate kinase [Candidatus Tisiphia endosymbiont of Beris chalybata]|uniref:amino acid kinase family protein n=1 Tax=Candidatus Tisiphia endosymbiont of Beris chalybata TaxID=3066262 RepID=UPI00312CAE37
MQKNCNLVWQNASNYKDKKDKGFAHTKNTTLIKEILRGSSEIRDQLLVVKLPSLIIENDELLTNFAEIIHLLDSCGVKIFIVHDHTNLVNDTLKLFGFEDKVINNVKIADYKRSQIMEMVLSGYINKRIVSKLCSVGCYAIGISCKDANLIQAKQSKLSHRRATNQDVIDIGFISEPVIVNPEILINFEDNNIIPVISPVASDENGNTHLLDVNLTVSLISSSLDADHLVLFYEESEFEGMQGLKVRDVNTLKAMLSLTNEPKKISLIEAALNAIQSSTECVHFVDATFPDSMLLSMFINKENAL